jgi:YD repeat-containing protein
MLSWFTRLFERRAEPIAPRVTDPSHKVTFDERVIRVTDADGITETVTWADLGNVEVITTGGGPFEVDLFWVLTDKYGRRGPVVPMGALGEHQLVRAMQVRLPGFDNMAVIEAMSSTGEAKFPIWPASPTNSVS